MTDNTRLKVDYTRGPARQILGAGRAGSLREQLDEEELRQLELGTGTLTTDQRRVRPLWFDGRFLAAADLTREANYFLARQADLSRAGGPGVIHGLMVSRSPLASEVVISEGLGVTPTGELVVIPSDLHVNVADVAEVQRLDAAFGLAQIPNQPVLSRSGLFVLALRAVEYTANPIASYPTSISGPRRQEDGDIIEATAVTLVPYPEEARSGGGRDQIDLRRARAARDIFVYQGSGGALADALPLALVALDRGVVRWIDPYMVRREVGGDQGGTLDLGLPDEAIREAYLVQYDHHLQDVLADRQSQGRGARFSASEHFLALPPAGRLPAKAIDAANFTQAYFPPEIDVELSFVPVDELRAVIQEALLLPPIDLTLTGEAQASTSVLVLIPVKRDRVRALQGLLPQPIKARSAAAPGLLAQRRPLEILRDFRPILTPDLSNNDPALPFWRAELNKVDLLWYVRRQNLNSKAAIVGQPRAVVGDEAQANLDLENNLRVLAVLTAYGKLRASATPQAVPLLARVFSPGRLPPGSKVTASALIGLLGNIDTVDSRVLLRLDDITSDPDFTPGIGRMLTLVPALQDPKNLNLLFDAGVLDDVARVGAHAPDDGFASTCGQKVAEVLTGSLADMPRLLRQVLDQFLKDLAL